MSSLFRGQWTGNTSQGVPVIANLGIEGNKIKGMLSEYEEIGPPIEENCFWIWSLIRGSLISSKVIEGTIVIESISTRYGHQLSKDQVEDLFQQNGAQPPTKISFRAKLKNNHILEIKSKAVFKDRPDFNQKFELTKDKLAKSTVEAEEMSWEEFKNYSSPENEGLIFRGQNTDLALQTSYHRTGYADLTAYRQNEIPQLEQHINSVTTHPYDISTGTGLGGLLNLAQHHGYPTPLLDWTKSQFIAAYFAFDGLAKTRNQSHVSIFVFENKKWSYIAGNNPLITAPNSMVRTIELPSFNNPRVLPQQSVTMFSNINNIESYIKTNEEIHKESFLRRIVIPATEAKHAVFDINSMGITSGALFPGLDGICKQLKNRDFKI